VCVSLISYNSQQEQSAEPKKNPVVEAPTVARRPKEASREKTWAAAGIRRFFSFLSFLAARVGCD